MESPAGLEQRTHALAEWLRARGSVLVAFSGGVDSAYLAVTARDVLGPDRSLAVMGVSDSLASHLRDRAHTLAGEFGVRLREVATHEIENADYAANRGDRCFHCKTELWNRLVPLAQAEGFDCVADGTITDDLGEHRPGRAAGTAAGVCSPLAECSFSKRDVREAARVRGIPIWDAPSSPCLASRVATGIPVTRAALARVDRAEAALRALGVEGDMRVRVVGEDARIELPPDALDEWLAAEGQARLASAMQVHGFRRVFLDLRGYRRGALQERVPASVVEVTRGMAHALSDTLS